MAVDFKKTLQVIKNEHIKQYENIQQLINGYFTQALIFGG